MAYEENEKHGSCWKRRTRLERSGIIVLVIAILAIIGLIIALVRISHQNNKKHNKESKNNPESLCLTEACVQSAAQIMKNMDPSANPCDDFYQFACGGFVKDIEIPADRNEISFFHMLHDVIQKQLRKMLEEPPKPDEPKPFRYAKNLYKVCMDTEAIDREGLTTVKRYFKEAGGWPMLEGTSWNEGQFEWTKTMQKFSSMGLYSDGILAAGLAVDPADSTKHMFMFDQADLNILRDNLIQGPADKVVDAYYKYLVDLAVFFGVDRKFAEYEVKPVINFQIDIAKISVSDELRHDLSALIHLMSITDLQQTYPAIQWLDFVNGMIGREDRYINVTTTVNVGAPQYMSSLFNLLSRTPKRVRANYMFFRAAYPLVTYLPDKIRNREQEFKAVGSGVATRPARWLECTAITTKQLQLAIDAMYVRSYFQEDARKAALQMVEDMKDEFVRMLNKLDWMDEDTRKTAIDKALSIESYIGYPEELLDDKVLGDYFAKLNMSESSYLKAINDINMFQMDKTLNHLYDPIVKGDWTQRIPAVTINAQYERQSNTIQFAAAFLQGVVFNKDRPHYMNYGSLAYIIAHEITHGFDDQGRLFDKPGNMVNWWANQTNKAYTEKAKCIAKQYSAITVPEIQVNLNGIITLSEDIADNGGIRQAYLAYNTWVEKNGVEPFLPGLNFTREQMFWISAASAWCSKERPQSMRNDIAIETHTLNHYRVVVPFANTEWFAKDFNCPAGAKMNPAHKCQVF